MKERTEARPSKTKIIQTEDVAVKSAGQIYKLKDLPGKNSIKYLISFNVLSMNFYLEYQGYLTLGCFQTIFHAVSLNYTLLRLTTKLLVTV